MKFEEVKRLMTEAHAKDLNCPHPCWAAEDAVPRGIIETQEQYDYIRYYSSHTEIGMEGMKSFEEDKGRYLNMGNHFGGASFYFCTESQDTALKYTKQYPDIFPRTIEWSWGKYGKIEF